MKVVYIKTKDGKGSGVRFESPTIITLDKGEKAWKAAFCHELAHVLLNNNKRDEVSYYRRQIKGYNAEDLRNEIMADRLAMSFCKSKYWKSKKEIKILKGWGKACKVKVNWKKFKFIPINKGIRFNKEEK